MTPEGITLAMPHEGLGDGCGGGELALAEIGLGLTDDGEFHIGVNRHVLDLHAGEHLYGFGIQVGGVHHFGVHDLVLKLCYLEFEEPLCVTCRFVFGILRKVAFLTCLTYGGCYDGALGKSLLEFFLKCIEPFLAHVVYLWHNRLTKKESCPLSRTLIIISSFANIINYLSPSSNLGFIISE